ncbi:MAG: hypothetical protein NC483_01810 [Ruminococcus sp.]|nr:hypothetical protein [Ruminococcus sp.]
MDQEDITSCLFNLPRLEIPEQDLTLLLDSYSVFRRHNDIYVIIANESYVSRGTNLGRLMAGLVKFRLLELDGKMYLERRLVIPFSSKLLLAEFLEDNKIKVVYMEGNKRHFKELEIKDGEVSFDDYAFLLENENLDRIALNNTYLIELSLPLERALKIKKDCVL